MSIDSSTWIPDGRRKSRQQSESGANPSQLCEGAALFLCAFEPPALQLMVKSLSVIGGKGFWASRGDGLSLTSLSSEIRCELRAHFVDDLLALQKLLDRPLPEAWFETHGIAD